MQSDGNDVDERDDGERHAAHKSTETGISLQSRNDL